MEIRNKSSSVLAGASCGEFYDEKKRIVGVTVEGCLNGIRCLYC